MLETKLPHQATKLQIEITMFSIKVTKFTTNLPLQATKLPIEVTKLTTLGNKVTKRNKAIIRTIFPDGLCSIHKSGKIVKCLGLISQKIWLRTGIASVFLSVRKEKI